MDGGEANLLNFLLSSDPSSLWVSFPLSGIHFFPTVYQALRLGAATRPQSSRRSVVNSTFSQRGTFGTRQLFIL